VQAASGAVIGGGAPEEDYSVYSCWTNFYKVCLIVIGSEVRKKQLHIPSSVNTTVNSRF